MNTHILACGSNLPWCQDQHAAWWMVAPLVVVSVIVLVAGLIRWLSNL